MLEKGGVDIVLLDIQMPGCNGIELAKQIEQLGLVHPPAIIFVTAFDDFAMQAFECHALDYLLKPVRAHRLAEAILRICQLRKGRQMNPEPLIASVASSLPTMRQHFSVMEKIGFY